MTQGPIGEAHVLISPDFRGFGARLKTELNAAVRAVKTPAVKIQFDIHKGSLAKAIAEANKILKASGVKAKIEFDLNRGSLTRSLTQAKAAARAAGIKAKVDVDDGGSIRRASRGFDLLGGRGRSALRSLSREVFTSNIRLREMANILGGATLPVLASLASVGVAAFGSLTSAIVAASAAAAALPGFLAAAVQAVGVGALAFGGLGDAVKAMGSAHDAAGTSALSSARKENTAAESIKAAQRGVRDALRGVTDAQKELTRARVDARQRLADLRLEEARLSLDLRGASLGIKEAEADLLQVTKDAGASELEQRKAQLAVEQALANQRRVNNDLRSTELDKQKAQLAVDEARSRQGQLDTGPTNLERQRAKLRVDEAKLAKTEIQRRIALNRQEVRSGVEGSDEVVAAKERQRDAARSLSDAQEALAKASRSAALATAGTVAPVSKLATAMDKLSPAGQRFARFLFSLKPKFAELRALAQAGLFPGLETAIRTLVGAHFPALRRIVDATAKTLGNLAVEGAKMMSTGPWQKDFETIGRTNVRLIDQFGHVGLNLADALRNIMVAARPLTEAIGDMALKWSENTRASAQAGRDSGKLGKFFERVKTIVVSLLRIIGNVGATIGAVFSAALPSGGKLIGSLEKATDKMRELATSTEGKQNLKEFFDKARPAVETIGGLIVTMARKIFEVIVHLKTATEAIARFLDKNPELKDLLGTVLALALAFKALNIAGLLGVVGSLGQLIAINPVLALVVGAVAALGAAFFFAYTHSRPFKETVDQLAATVKDAVLPALKSFGRFIKEDVVPALERALPFIKDQLLAGLRGIQGALRDNEPQLRLFGAILLSIGKLLAVTVLPLLLKFASFLVRNVGAAISAGIAMIGVLGRAFETLLRIALVALEGILDGAVTAFGWIPGIGPKLKTAQEKFKGFKDSVNSNLDKLHDKEVKVSATFGFKTPPGVSIRDIVGNTKFKGAARGMRVTEGSGPTADDVLLRVSRGETVVSAHDSAAPEFVSWAQARRIPGFASGGRVGGVSLEARLPSASAFAAVIDRFEGVITRVIGGLASRFDRLASLPSAVSHAAGSWKTATNFLTQLGIPYSISSTFRPGARTHASGRQSYHALNRAVDLTGPNMMAIWKALVGTNPTELIYSRAPRYKSRGGWKPISQLDLITKADHFDHVHAAYDKGGLLMPGITMAENRTGRPEMVTPAGRDALGRVRFGGQGLTVHNLIVQPLSGQFRLRDVMTELQLQGVH